MNDQPMTHADWLRAIAAWAPDHAEQLQEAADEFEFLTCQAASWQGEAERLAQVVIDKDSYIATLVVREIKPLREALKQCEARPHMAAKIAQDALCTLTDVTSN